MLGFDPRISGIESDHSANCATTTAQNYLYYGRKNITTLYITRF